MPQTGRSLSRGLQILEALGGDKRFIRFTELQERTGLGKSTLHYLLKALSDRDYVVFDPTRGGYCLGPKVSLLARSWVMSVETQLEARKQICDLEAAVNLPVYLAYLLDRSAVLVETSPMGAQLPLLTVGMRLPLHATALGKILLAGLNEAQITHLCADTMVQLTEKTITNLPELVQELRTIRLNGYATDEEEGLPGLACVAVPIMSKSGAHVAAALAVALTVEDYRMRDLQNLVRGLWKHGQMLSKTEENYGGHGFLVNGNNIAE